jgi:hypothetical protein
MIYEELRQALTVQSKCNDSATVAGANGLLKQLSDFRVILCLHIIEDVLVLTGPCSRIFQAVSTDLAVAVTTVKMCKSSLQMKREDKSHFNQLLRKAKDFASKHGINPHRVNRGEKLPPSALKRV